MKVMLIDGNSIVNRAFYGIRQLTNHEGMPTNAIYGFLATLFRLQEDEKPDKTVVCFDVKEKTFRHERFETYKATRKGMPDELAVQMPVLKEVLAALDDVILCELPGYEADDLLGTFSKQAEQDGTQCIVVTGDKDSLQLIGEHASVLLVTTRMGQTTYETYDQAKFEEKYGFAPGYLVDLKALMGDSSDNISGVPGIGEKGAMKLMQQFGSLDAIYENLDSEDIAKGVRVKLENGEQAARDSYFLATINRDAPVPFDINDLPEHKGDDGALYELLKRLEFKNFIVKRKLSPSKEESSTQAEQTAIEYVVLHTSDAAVQALQALDKARDVTLHWDGAQSLCILQDTQGYIAVEQAFTVVRDGLFSGDYQIVMHDAKPMLQALLEAGKPARGIAFDVSIAAYLLDPTQSDYALDRLSLAYLGQELDAGQSADGQLTLGDADVQVQHKKLFTQTLSVQTLAPILREKIDALQMHDLYYEMELPLITVLAEMQRIGCKVDRSQLMRFGEGLKERIGALEVEIYADAGEEFNINSPKQLGVILFEKLSLPVKKKTKTGYSTNVEVLESLKGFHPIVEHVLSYRQLSKLNSTYVDGLLKTIDPADGRIHSHFQQTVTATGRLSSTDPNLQNIPVRTELGREMRRMFTAENEDYVLVDADYSQIELRVLAHIANDENMIEAFQAGQDIHAATASKVYHVPIDEVTPQMRSSCKAVNFGIVYGISDFSLAQDIGVSRKEAGEFIGNYLATYSGVARYMEESKQQGRERGYAVTLFGRRRALSEIQSKNFNLRSFGERVAMNMPIQGTAADIIKIAMVRVYKRLQAEGLKSRLILQVHDELILESPKQEAQYAKQLLTEEMEQVMQLRVPLVADAKIGFSWYDTK